MGKPKLWTVGEQGFACFVRNLEQITRKPDAHKRSVNAYGGPLCKP